MKTHRIMAVVLAAIFVCSVSAYASVDLGVDADFVLKKSVGLTVAGESVKADLSGQYCDIVAKVKLGEIVKLTPRIGVNTLQIEGVNDLEGLKIDSSLGYSVGIGAEVAVAQTKYAELSLIGDYRYTRSEIDKIGYNSVSITNPLRNTVAIHQYEIGIKAEKNLSDILGVASLTPYVGVVYSDLKGTAKSNGLVTLTGAELKADIDARSNIGIRTGIKCTPIDNLDLAINAKLIDETSIGASATYRF